MFASLTSFVVGLPLIFGGFGTDVLEDTSYVAVASTDSFEEIADVAEQVNNLAQVNGSHCGTAARNYAYSDSALSGTLCASGNPSPPDPLFPAAGSSNTWSCDRWDGSHRWTDDNGSSQAWNPPYTPECPFNATAGRIIVEFGDGTIQTPGRNDLTRRLRSDGITSPGRHVTNTVSQTIPAGTYTVRMMTWDRRWSGYHTPQTDENWFAVLTNNGGSILATTDAIDDIPDQQWDDCSADYCRENMIIQEVQDDFVVPSGVRRVYGQHAAYSTGSSNSNSISVICVAFDDNSVVSSPPADDRYCTATRDDQKPDLDPRPTNISSSTIARGNSVTFTARIDNDGDATAGPFNIGGIYIDTDADDIADYIATSSNVTGNTSPGGLKTKNTVWTIPTDAPIGTYRVGYTADVDDDVDESDETNNWSGWRSFTVTAPNPTGTLTICESDDNPGNCVTSGTIDVDVNDTLDISWTTSDASSCTVDASTGPDNWSPNTSNSVVSSAVTTSMTYTLTCDGDNGSSGVVIESITVDPSALSDLVAGTTQLSTTTVRIGDTITFTTSITNIGNIDSGSYTIGGFDIDNDNDGVADYTFPAGSVGGTTMIETEAVAVPVAIPVGMPTGVSRVRYIADVDNDETELDEGNNDSGWTDFTILPALPPSLVTIESCLYNGSVSDCNSSARQISSTSSQEIAIRWDSVGATACSPTGGSYYSTGGATSGTDTDASEPDPGENRVYSVVCQNYGTWSVPVSVSVEKLASTPVLTVAGVGANNLVRIEDSVNLDWDTTDSATTTCSIDGGGFNMDPLASTTGNTGDIVIQGTTTFTLDCQYGIDTETINIIPGAYES